MVGKQIDCVLSLEDRQLVDTQVLEKAGYVRVEKQPGKPSRSQTAKPQAKGKETKKQAKESKSLHHYDIHH